MGSYRIKINSLAYPSQPPLLKQISLTIDHNAFTIIAGASGCGKTTLLRMLKPQLQPKMDMDGTITWEEGQKCTLLCDMKETDAAFWIGYVAQNPASQLISDQIWHELAFGLENMGMDRESIHQRIAETVSFLGIEDWYHEPVSSLSGGQIQMLNLARVLMLRPKFILLDEPASQLDPISKQHFLDLLLRIHQEYTIGILMVEHHLEPLLSVCDRIIYLQNKGVVYDGDARHVCNSQVLPVLLPYPARYAQAMHDAQNPIQIKEMRQKHYQVRVKETTLPDSETVLQCEQVYLRYDKEGRDILRDLSMELKRHEIFCLFGGNGSGKTTLLKVLGAKHRDRYGKIKVTKRLLYLPQDPRILFVRDSLAEEYASCSSSKKDEIIKQMQLSHLLQQHPYDLSGGELQRAAIALLLMNVEEEVIFLLDEPTKGMDMEHKESFAHYLIQLCKTHSVLMVTHDVEFAAMCSDRCAFLFDGKLSSCKATRAFFMDHYFYTTYWYRVTMQQDTPAICYEELCNEA